MTCDIIIASINVEDDQYITYMYTDDIICQYAVPHIVYKLFDHRIVFSGRVYVYSCQYQCETSPPRQMLGVFCM